VNILKEFMPNPTAFSSLPAAVLFEGEADNMASNWIEYIVATRSDKKIYGVYARKNIEEWINGKYIKKLRTVEKVVGVKDPLSFIAAVKKCAEELSLDTEDIASFDWLIALRELSRLDCSFSEQVKSLLNPKLL
jgi:hypothetical protein